MKGRRRLRWLGHFRAGCARSADGGAHARLEIVDHVPDEGDEDKEDEDDEEDDDVALHGCGGVRFVMCGGGFAMR